MYEMILQRMTCAHGQETLLDPIRTLDPKKRE